MILYLDTSALVKLFVEERESSSVVRAVTGARLIVTHSIAYVEACSAFSRVARTRRQERLIVDLRSHLDRLWRSWEIIAVTEALVRRAADLTNRYPLRAYDSMHLAAAESVFTVMERDEAFRFAVFDDRLRDVAGMMGMEVLGA